MHLVHAFAELEPRLMSHDDLAPTGDVTDLQSQLEARAREHAVLSHRVQPATWQSDAVNDTAGVSQ